MVHYTDDEAYRRLYGLGGIMTNDGEYISPYTAASRTLSRVVVTLAQGHVEGELPIDVSLHLLRVAQFEAEGRRIAVSWQCGDVSQRLACDLTQGPLGVDVASVRSEAIAHEQLAGWPSERLLVRQPCGRETVYWLVGGRPAFRLVCRPTLFADRQE